MSSIVSMKITMKIFKFYRFPMNFHNFIRCILCKILQIYQKISPIPFWAILLFIYILTIVSVNITTKIFKFSIFTWISIIYSEMLYKNLQFYLKMSPLSFLLIYGCTCMTFILFEILSQKSSILSIFLCFHPFYHPYIRCKASELT